MRGIAVSAALLAWCAAGSLAGGCRGQDVGRTFSNTESPSAQGEPASQEGAARFEVNCIVRYWGLDKGDCSFMNVGSRAGAVCGVVSVRRRGGAVVSEDNICSGVVVPQSLSRVRFELSGLVRGCSDGLFDNEEDHCVVEFRSK